MEAVLVGHWYKFKGRRLHQKDLRLVDSFVGDGRGDADRVTTVGR